MDPRPARARPAGGVVERGAYDAWKAEILEGLAAAGPLDGLFFDIHGAMSVQGMDDAEGDLINAIRGVIGPRAHGQRLDGPARKRLPGPL